MKILVFSLTFFFFSPLLFSETLTSTEVDAIVRTDPIRANTERSIILSAGMVANKLAPSKAIYYVNFMRAYAWVMNDMKTGSNTVYNFSPYWKNMLRTMRISLDTNSVTTYLATMIIGAYEESHDENLVILFIASYHFIDESNENLPMSDPIIKGLMARAEAILRKIIALANQL